MKCAEQKRGLTAPPPSKRKKRRIIWGILLAASAILIFFAVYFSVKPDYAELQAVIEQEWYSGEEEGLPEFMRAFDERAEFEILDVRSEGKGYASVTVAVTSPDISAAITEKQADLQEKPLTTSELDSQLAALVRTANPKTTRQTIAAIATEDGTIHIRFSEGFVDAMYGYAYTDAMETLMREQAQAMKEGIQ